MEGQWQGIIEGNSDSCPEQEKTVASMIGMVATAQHTTDRGALCCLGLLHGRSLIGQCSRILWGLSARRLLLR